MVMKVTIFHILFFLSLVFTVFGQSANEYSFDQNGSLKGAAIGVMVSDVNNGATLFTLNSDLLLAPASTLKLVISAVALETLGADFRFRTSLGLSGSGDIVNGVLRDNLVVKGGGDPTLASGLFAGDRKDLLPFGTWIKTLKSLGVKKIEGNLLIDISGFRRWDIPASWAWDDMGNYYGAGPSAINYSDNTIRLYFDSPDREGKSAIVSHTVPLTPGIEWVSEVKSSQINRDLAYVFGSPWDKKRIIRGTIPANRKNFEVKASMPDPEMLFGERFRQELLAEYPDFKGEVLVSLEPVEEKIIQWHQSPELSEICSLLNHESVNLIAESLVAQLSYRKGGYGDHDEGIQLAGKFMSQNITNEPFFMEDGSGLSRFNAFSAKQMNAVLLFMQKSKNREVFKNSLPVAGKGTLASFPQTDFPGQTLRAKSGSMTRVRAYTGYLQCKSGREVAFSLVFNNFSGSQQEVLMEVRKFLQYVRSNY
jgi:D-alanyl-D-alanine carboxypeptidase/D-alanyl-D-alanine-endopeptidase (penicillin-binding protein 4)